jgi:hypothetical protein
VRDAPEGQGKLGSVAGEVLGAGAVSRLRGRPMSLRAPSA